MALSSPGIGSNLDVNGIVSQLMSIESRPLTALDTKEVAYQAKLSAYGSLNGALSSFQSSVSSLSNLSRFQSVIATAADATVFTASANSTAVPGTYSVNIGQMAQSQTIMATGQASTTAAIGLGTPTTLTFSFGTVSGGTLTGGVYSGATFTQDATQATGTVTINSSNNSLQGIRDAINAANIGVTATIVNDGSATPNRLVIASTGTGATKSIRIGVTGDATLQGLLGYDPSGTQNMVQTAAAQNATATVNGVAVSSATNSVTGAIQGVTLNLSKIGSTTLNVVRDTASVQSAVNSFVKAYNDINNTLNTLTAYNPATKKAAVMTGDATAYIIQSSIRSTLSAALPGIGGGLTSLSQIGVSFQKDGSLSLDATKLQTAIANNFGDVASLFAAVGKPTDSLVSYVSSTDKTKPGSYSLNVSQLATQGTLVGSAAAQNYANMTGSAVAGLTIVATPNPGANDTLNITIDGVSSTVTLAPAVYASATALAAQVQSAINTNPTISAAGKSVTVTQNNGVLSIRSNSLNPGSQVSIAGGNGLTNLLGATQTTNTVTTIAAGVNDQMSVTVDGVSATATLAAGNYTAAQLAALMQSAINGASTLIAAGNTVSANQTAGVFTITSNRYGSASNVSISGTAAATILGGTPAATAGLDVAGSINSVAATGSGQSLTGLSGSGSDGLKLQISGGATGSRGTINFSKGYAYNLNALVTGMQGANGLISARTNGINQSIKDIGTQRDAINRRLVAIEANYRAQFTALDAMMSKMSQTSSYLTQQLASLPKS